jgi:uncharacterized protein YndB with AHSA1/START domain
MNRPSLTLVRRLKASPAKVYAAFTRPEHLARWWGPDPGVALEAEADVRPGGRYRIVFHTRDGLRNETIGEYQVVEPERRLVFTFQWAQAPDRRSLVTVDLAAVADGTELTILHEDFADDLVGRTHNEGWNGALDRLQSLVETPETSPERTEDA